MRIPGSSCCRPNAGFIALALACVLACCGDDPPRSGPMYGDSPDSAGMPVLRIAVHPLHNPATLLRRYQPLVEYLNRRQRISRFTLEASRDYAAFEEKFRHRKAEVLLPNPWQTLKAIEAGYHVIAMAGEPRDFRGLIIVRKDGAVRTPADLIGRTVSYPSRTALAACIMPQYFLHTRGVDIRKDIDHRYVGSQESAIMNVYLRKSAAGATWPPPWRAFQRDHPREAAALTVMWETEALVNNSVMLRDDVPAEIRARIMELLFELHLTPEGSEILAGMETARFLPATDRQYDPVRRYIERFEREVRKVEAP